MSRPTHISVKRARAHNLKDVDLEVPRDALVVFTGVSGSGKSSLAFDTIYKEGQRRFMESLSSYARQFLGQMERPEVDEVTGVSPTLSVDQKTVNRNPRSTVGTVTEIYDHLRLLMARLGTPHCPECHTEIRSLALDHVIDDALERFDGQKIQVLAPMVRERKGQYRQELEQLATEGWVRVRVDGEIRRLDEEFDLARYEKHTIEVVVDRMKLHDGLRIRLAEALETALAKGEADVATLLGESGEHTYSTSRACPNHPGINIPELEPRLFSFNAPQGACPTCNGLGKLEDFDVDRLVHLDKKVADAFQAFNDDGKLPFAHFNRAQLKKVAKALGGPANKPLEAWDPDRLDRLLFGDAHLIVQVEVERPGGRTEIRERPWQGLVPMTANVWRWTKFPTLERFRTETPCPDCGGDRLSAVSRAVEFRGQALPAFTKMSVREARRFFEGLELDGSEREVGEAIVDEIRHRLLFLDEVGLGYLSLERSAATLSGGEAQRIRLAAQVGSALQGVTYVLDEPSIGLHPRDNKRLLTALHRLRDRGNSVLVVEHDAETMLAADHVVDVGPGAGRLGGHVVASTTPGRFARSKGLTAAYLRGEEQIPVPEKRRKPKGWLDIRGARANNLRGIDVKVPLGVLCAVTGVSGSGKSSLMFSVLESSLTNHLGGDKHVEACDQIKGLAKVDKLIRISQQPIGRTPRSNPATYVGAFDHIRKLYAKTAEARARGYKAGRFSFNVKGGRCEACEGAGVKTVEMQFLPSVEVLCDVCEGTRFNAETLEITWKARTIADVLAMTIEEAWELFKPVPALDRILGTMVEVGLGYVPLGQPSTTISGGEAQRVKLATELHKRSTGNTLYLLDEPTTGLHFDDVRKLVHALQGLVDAGNSVLVIEHDTDVVKCADWVLDMGPEGGDAGGELVGSGTPEDLAKLDTPTGHSLAQVPELGGVAVVHEPPPRRRNHLTGPTELVIEGARKHNLRGVDVRIPHGKMTVVTGVSGSGKSSLAFDTIFSEGQRRYVECLSTYARRFLGRLDRAPVERMEGLAPAIAIDQVNASRNPRSTVATVTEIHDVLRVLWARVGEPHCPKCARPIVGYAPSQAAQRLSELDPGAGWLTTNLRPAEDPASRISGLVEDGWTRLLAGGDEVRLDEEGDAERARGLVAGGAVLVLDRLNPARSPATRVSEAVANGYAVGDGSVTFVPRRDGEPIVLTARPTCPDHGSHLPVELTPRHFSFNSRVGACPRCEGLGSTRQIVPELLFPAQDLRFWEAMDGRVAGVLARSPRNRNLVAAVLDRCGATEQAVQDWSESTWDAVMDGLPGTIALSWSRKWGKTVQRVEEEREWPGLIAILDGWSSRLSWLSAESVCRTCKGGRLAPSLLAVTIAGQGIHAFTGMTVESARDQVLAWAFEGERAAIADRPMHELRKRLSFLCDVGLGYLGLDRSADTLSGGEAQRIRLASQLGSGLTGVVYVLDEPTIGLHPRDTERLLGTLEELRDLGNTLVVVEHDPETIRRADHVLDLGPGAGVHGGELVASGTPDELRADPNSLTGAWLSGAQAMPPRETRRTPRAWLSVTGARSNNLQGVDARVPTGVWTAVTGVSGSGKSSLVLDTLVPMIKHELGQQAPPVDADGLEFGEKVDRLVVVDQSPIGRSPRSTAATYTGIMDELRKVYAKTPAAKARGFTPGRFSFNSPGGRCEACEGRGAILVEMHFLPDVWVTCETCRGRRFNRETGEIRYKGKSIAEVLALRADEVLELFKNHRKLARQLQALVDVGLGYLTLGQPGTTLSGGEAQRVKLASELTSRKGHCVYVLDEPTTGLHLADVAKLVEVLHALVDKGHTVLTIEHHTDVWTQADYVLDLGPEGGVGGGELVGEGIPEWVAMHDTPTGRAMASALS
ncbi:MAG: excinuclease ABC subunit UvrA [Deltaproteobacteria bacterium]|nr:MAG: excinuclease ABC subunit UvrA [Deltaproteobacteria bacterium]